MSPHIWWYLSRSAGIVSWLMLTASVLGGVVLATDLFARWRRAAWLLDLHRWLAGLTIFFVAGHLAALVADSYAHFGPRELLIPFASTWRPTAVAVGVVAVWLLLAVEATALARKRLPDPWWRGLHIAGYVVFWAVSVHGALAGTDASRMLYTVSAILVVAATMFAATYRILTRDLPKRRPAGVRKRPSRPPTTVRDET